MKPNIRRIGAITADDPDRALRQRVLACLLGTGRTRADDARVRRFLEQAARYEIALGGLYGLIDHSGAVRAALLLSPGAGRTSLLSLSRGPISDPDGETSRMVAEVCAEAVEEDVLVQALLDAGETESERRLLAAGFQPLATLSYLERPLSTRRLPPLPVWPDEVEPAAWDHTARSEMERLLESTYEQTLDCPGLQGLRRTSDILDGHLSASRHDSELWQVLRLRNRPVGLMLIGRDDERRGAELIYLGLAPDVRGRGLARQFLRLGLHHSTAAGLRVMHCAVDDANVPAVQLYASEGFSRIARRRACILPPRLKPGERRVVHE